MDGILKEIIHKLKDSLKCELLVSKYTDWCGAVKEWQIDIDYDDLQEKLATLYGEYVSKLLYSLIRTNEIDFEALAIEYHQELLDGE